MVDMLKSMTSAASWEGGVVKGGGACPPARTTVVLGVDLLTRKSGRQSDTKTNKRHATRTGLEQGIEDVVGQQHELVVVVAVQNVGNQVDLSGTVQMDEKRGQERPRTTVSVFASVDAC